MKAGTSERVALVVDDEHFARLFAVQVLLDQGFTVLEASSAAEALEVLRDNPDTGLVLTDVGMPGAEDGLALAEEVRRSRPRLPLIITSGLAPVRQLSDGQPVAFLAKPSTALALIEAVAEVTGVPAKAGRAIHSVSMLAHK